MRKALCLCASKQKGQPWNCRHFIPTEPTRVSLSVNAAVSDPNSSPSLATVSLHHPLPSSIITLHHPLPSYFFLSHPFFLHMHLFCLSFIPSSWCTAAPPDTRHYLGGKARRWEKVGGGCSKPLKLTNTHTQFSQCQLELCPPPLHTHTHTFREPLSLSHRLSPCQECNTCTFYTNTHTFSYKYTHTRQWLTYVLPYKDTHTNKHMHTETHMNIQANACTDTFYKHIKLNSAWMKHIHMV